MRKSKIFFTVFLIITIFLATIFISSCKSDPVPELTEPILTLTLSETSPQKEVIISWTSSNDAQNYSIERTMVRDSITDTRYFEWRETDEICSKDDKFFYLTDKTCESGTEYTYVVTASARWYSPEVWKTTSKKSKEKSITTSTDPKATLNWPKNIKVEAAVNQRNALTVTWNTVENATAYEVYCASGVWIHFNEKFVKLDETDQTTYTKKYLPNESDYTFMIKAVKGDEYSLFSAKASGTVAKAENLTRSKAVMLENGIREQFFSYSDSLWFKCKPEKGLISFYCNNDLYDTSLSVFLEDGTIVASGLPLFILNENDNENVSRLDDEENYNAIVRDIKNDIKNFSSGTTYVLRIVKNYVKGFSICVE